MILLKIHNEGLISLCDSDLIGKKFEEGELQLDVSKRFYNGKKASKKEIVSALKDAKTANIVGDESIKFALDEKIITKETVKEIDGVPHAQIFTL